MLMLASAGAALAIGCVGALLAANDMVHLSGGWVALIPPNRQVAFIAVAAAHLASYGVGALGGLTVMVATTRQRRRRQLQPGLSPSASS
jgi:hypothetical protein